ncbi:MAG: multicopper oxidase domain-containing protein, partial [Rhodoferax sp.]|nr:multicopper oxidase domain-containing protein [Rhodoferax sp.]
MKRRELLQALACAPLAPSAAQAAAQHESRTRALRAAPASLPAAGLPALDAWAFDGRVPGPVLRARRGEWFDLTLHNVLPDPTTIHWHGVRV